MGWQVGFTGRAAKQAKSLPKSVRERLAALAFEIESRGPVRGNWKNYRKLTGVQHHCHLKSGKPTYVACWIVKGIAPQVVEI